MIKVVFMDDTRVLLDATKFLHDHVHNCFVVCAGGKENSIMIPDANVKIIGTTDTKWVVEAL